MLIDGSDLLLVSRSTLDSQTKFGKVRKFYNTHNSNSVFFTRIQNFRERAELRWSTFTDEYAIFQRDFIHKQE